MSKFNSLSQKAQEAFVQLFVDGPQWDGLIVSKAGRDELYAAGLIDRDFGWQWLTRAGVEIGAHTFEAKYWHDPRWHEKLE